MVLSISSSGQSSMRFSAIRPALFTSVVLAHQLRAAIHILLVGHIHRVGLSPSSQLTHQLGCVLAGATVDVPQHPGGGLGRLFAQEISPARHRCTWCRGAGRHAWNYAGWGRSCPEASSGCTHHPNVFTVHRPSVKGADSQAGVCDLFPFIHFYLIILLN